MEGYARGWLQDEICKCSDKPATRNSRGGGRRGRGKREGGERGGSRGLYIKQKCARCQGYGGKRATKKCRFDKGCKLEKKKGGGSEGWKEKESKREREREMERVEEESREREVEETRRGWNPAAEGGGSSVRASFLPRSRHFPYSSSPGERRREAGGGEGG